MIAGPGPACPQPGRDAHHDHHGDTRAAQPATGEHNADTMSTNCRTRARNARFYMLTVSVAAVLILSDA